MTELDDPFKYTHIASSIDYILDISYDYPDYFPLSEGLKCVSSFIDKNSEAIKDMQPPDFDRALRNHTLNRVRELCATCTRCSLHKNREFTPGRGSVFGDGSVDASGFLVGEGPGEYESRTLLPFVGQVALRASSCALRCSNYEACYIAGKSPDGPYSYTPNRDCNYTEAKLSKEVLVERMKRRAKDVYTAGAMLEKALARAGFRRLSTSILQARLGKLGMDTPEKNPNPNIYITNAVRCRAANITEDKKLENTAPTQQQIDACRPWMRITERLVKPKVRIAMGSVGLKSLEMSSEGITSRSGNRETDKDGNDVFVLLHPAYIMRQKEQDRPELENALTKGLFDARVYADGK